MGPIPGSGHNIADTTALAFLRLGLAFLARPISLRRCSRQLGPYPSRCLVGLCHGLGPWYGCLAGPEPSWPARSDAGPAHVYTVFVSLPAFALLIRCSFAFDYRPFVAHLLPFAPAMAAPLQVYHGQ